MLFDAVRNAGAEAAVLCFGAKNTVSAARRESAAKLLRKNGIPFAETAESFAEMMREHHPRTVAVFADSPVAFGGFPLPAGVPEPAFVGGMFDQWHFSAPELYSRVFLCIQDFKTEGERCADLLLRMISGENITGIFSVPSVRIAEPERRN